MEERNRRTGCTWVTVVGWSPMAVVNSVWLACERGMVPDRIVLLASCQRPGISENVQSVRRWLTALLPQFGVHVDSMDTLIVERDMDDDDVLTFQNRLAEVLRDEQATDRLVVDATPGRKFMSALAIKLGANLGATNVFYNHLRNQQYVDVPHPLIPRHEQQFVDLPGVLGHLQPGFNCVAKASGHRDAA